MGFSVIFHSMPSSHFARPLLSVWSCVVAAASAVSPGTSPLGAGAFHVGLPHAMLEALSAVVPVHPVCKRELERSAECKDVLTQRCVGPLGENFTVWTNGSLIVLLSAPRAAFRLLLSARDCDVLRSAYLLQEEHVASRHWTRLG